MSYYVVVDTNVLISALLSSKDDAATVQVIGKMLSGEVTPVYSHDILGEYHEVLKRKKFGFSTETINYLLSAIEKFGVLINASPLDVQLPDMKDLPFYEIILEKRSDNAYLITGNIKHFPQAPYIVTPRQFLNILEQKN